MFFFFYSERNVCSAIHHKIVTVTRAQYFKIVKLLFISPRNGTNVFWEVVENVKHDVRSRLVPNGSVTFETIAIRISTQNSTRATDCTGRAALYSNTCGFAARRITRSYATTLLKVARQGVVNERIILIHFCAFQNDSETFDIRKINRYLLLT